MGVYDDTIGAILDNYADAIEGGRAYRGSGTLYKGIPSARGIDDILDELDGVAANANGTTTTAKFADSVISESQGERLVVTNKAPYFIRCESGTASNVGWARPITAAATAASTTTITVSPGFPAATSSADTFAFEQGFKRATDDTDFEAEDTLDHSGHDRAFSLRMDPGKRLPWYGDGYEFHESTLVLRVRLLKRGRERTARKTTMECIQRMLTILPRHDLRGDYIQSLDAIGQSPTYQEDSTKVVASVNFRAIYRVDARYL